MAIVPAVTLPPSGSGVGVLLRYWRLARHLSQLDLALETGVSSRHLSCVETGRSQPSREMVTRLADALQIPLRERNALLVVQARTEPGELLVEPVAHARAHLRLHGRIGSAAPAA